MYNVSITDSINRVIISYKTIINPSTSIIMQSSVMTFIKICNMQNFKIIFLYSIYFFVKNNFFDTFNFISYNIWCELKIL